MKRGRAARTERFCSGLTTRFLPTEHCETCPEIAFNAVWLDRKIVSKQFAHHSSGCLQRVNPIPGTCASLLKRLTEKPPTLSAQSRNQPGPFRGPHLQANRRSQEQRIAGVSGEFNGSQPVTSKRFLSVRLNNHLQHNEVSVQTRQTVPRGRKC